jgi:hypothetical protein
MNRVLRLSLADLEAMKPRMATAVQMLAKRFQESEALRHKGGKKV